MNDNSEISFIVIVSYEEQYSIWPTGTDLQPGWHSIGKPGTKEECLLYIEEIQTEISPLNFRGKRRPM